MHLLLFVWKKFYRKINHNIKLKTKDVPDVFRFTKDSAAQITFYWKKKTSETGQGLGDYKTTIRTLSFLLTFN